MLSVPLKSICEQHFESRSAEQQYFANGLLNRDVTFEADDAPTMLQSRDTIPFLVVNVCPQPSVDTDTGHKDGMASSVPL